MSGRTLLHYELLDKLGEGAMGVVYRARDTRLDRPVAIKMLAQGRLLDTTARRRFQREARAASALNHPNIITIYETNSDSGTDFIVMELVSGRSLHQLLKAGPLPVATAIDYGVQIANALAKAHAAGVIHRDLKPSNIMITDEGLVKVLDFGLAKVEQSMEATASGGEAISHGFAVGTLTYMSPEQARGEAVTAASDVFSFGIVFFQMLTGRLPFDTSSYLTLLNSLNFAPPKDMLELRPETPAPVAAVIARALEKDRGQRYPDMRDLARDLRRISVDLFGTATRPYPVYTVTMAQRLGFALRTRPRLAAALLVALLAGIAVLLPATRRPLARAVQAIAQPWRGDPHRVPDNPFALQSQAQKYLERWDVPENLDNAIDLLDRAIALDRDYAPAYATLAQAYWEKNRLAPDTQWTKLAAQSAERAVALNPDLADAHIAAGLASMAAGSADQAQKQFTRAAALDPKSAKPHRWLGFLATQNHQNAEAEQQLQRALQLEPEDWRSHMDLGLLYYKAARYPEAAGEWEQVTRLTPGNFVAFKNLGAVYHMLDRYEDAASALQRSLAIKASATTYNNLGTLRFFQGQYTEAVPAFEKAVQLAAGNYLFWGNLGDAYRWAPGRAAEAKPAYRNAIRLLREEMAKRPDDIDLRATLAVYLAKTGDREGARAEIAKAEQAVKRTPTTLFKTAIARELCGEREPALAALAAALKAGYSVREVKNEPELLALRSDARYQQIMNTPGK